MAFDESSLLLAIGCAACALAITTMMVWVGARSYGFLLFWGGGLAFCVPSVAILGLLLSPYSPLINFFAFVLLITGVILIEASGAHFRTGRFIPKISLPAWVASVGAVGAAFGVGLSGLGVILLNLVCGVVFFATAVEFWRARGEARAALWGVAIAYAILAVSFLLCMVPLIQNGQYVLHARQQNWAEDLNSLTIIISLCAIGALMLVVAQNRSTQQQRSNAMSDMLTGLLNRRALFEMASGLTAGGCAVIMFDLDHFKAVNDRFGHAQGDEVIRRFADAIRRCVRNTDIAARLGGEEFCVVVPGPSPGGAVDLAERIRAAIAATEPLAADCGPPTVSAGLAVGGPGADFDQLLRDADAALYKAKEAGRNRIQGPAPRLAA